MHDLIRHDGSYWPAMDYHRGGTWPTDPRPTPITAGRRRRFGLHILAALRAIHAAGVEHCDVKPANLVLGDDGRLVLIDFGIAEVWGGDRPHPARRDGGVGGSPAYMAPELVREEAPSPSADLWSLGATLYTAVEGRPPSRTMTRRQLLPPCCSTHLHPPDAPAG